MSSSNNMSLKRQRIVYLQQCINEMEEEIREIEEDILENGDEPIILPTNVTEEIVSLSQDQNPTEYSADFIMSVRAATVEKYFWEGDSPPTDHYCHIKFLKDDICSRMFFGVLLGLTDNKFLSTKHIDAWITRAMMYLYKQRDMGNQAEWSIMPTYFNRYFDYPFTEEIMKYGDGSTDPYPALWKVKNILFPICFRGEYWCILHLDLRTHEYVIYDTNLSYISDSERSWIFEQYERSFCTYLIHVKYFPRGEKLRENPTFKYANINQFSTTAEESGVLLCMFLQNLILGKPLNFEEGTNYQDSIRKYRVYMARKLYAGRT